VAKYPVKVAKRNVHKSAIKSGRVNGKADWLSRWSIWTYARLRKAHLLSRISSI